MTPRDSYLPGVPCWVDTTQPDLDAAADFYGGLFGWTFERRTPPQAPVQFSMARLDGLDVAGLVGPEPDADPGAPATWNTYVAVESVDRSLEVIRDHGGTVTTGPSDVPHAGRAATCADPAGAAFSLWESHGRIGAQVVNLAGSWNWSTLATGDPAAAIAFYAAVFGWAASGEVLDGPTLLTRPGYGDLLFEQVPGLRQMHESAPNLPEGFSDAVAWVEQQDDRAPRWDVMFAVADTAAATARAVELGAQVLVAPHHDGPTELGVLRDPQGAELTLAHYAG